MNTYRRQKKRLESFRNPKPKHSKPSRRKSAKAAATTQTPQGLKLFSINSLVYCIILLLCIMFSILIFDVLNCSNKKKKVTGIFSELGFMIILTKFKTMYELSFNLCLYFKMYFYYSCKS